MESSCNIRGVLGSPLACSCQSLSFSSEKSTCNRFKYYSILQNLLQCFILFFVFFFVFFVFRCVVSLRLQIFQFYYICVERRKVGTGKSFFYVSPFVTREVCDQDWASSLVTLANVFVSSLFIEKFCVCNLKMSCAVEINSNDNGAFKQQHVESCSSTA